LLIIVLVDWEFPASPQEGNQYLKLLIELRKRLPLPKYLLHVSILAGEWALRNVSLPDIAETVDLVGVMAYDFVNANYLNCAYSGHHAQLWSPKNPPSSAYMLSGDSAVTYILGKGVPAGKVALGIPLYGRSFLKVRAIFKRYKRAGGNDGVFEVRQLPRPRTKEKYDDVLCAAFCVGGDGGLVSYDSKISLRRKAEYVKEKGLAGMFYWHIGQDRAGDESLIREGYNVLFRDQQQKIASGSSGA
jgi:chitinase